MTSAAGKRTGIILSFITIGVAVALLMGPAMTGLFTLPDNMGERKKNITTDYKNEWNNESVNVSSPHLSFDGDSDYIEVADDSSIQIQSGMTISARVDAEDRLGPPQGILSKGKYSLKEYDDYYIFEAIGDNSGASHSKSGDVGTNPYGLAVYDGKLYTSCRGSDDVYVFDGTSWSKSGDVGTSPRGIAVYDGKLYTSCAGSDDVYVFDGTSWGKSGGVGNNPLGLAVYDGKLYTSCFDSDDVYVFDGTSWSKSGDVGTNPRGIAVYDGKLYTACFDSDDVYVFDGTSWSKSGDVGNSPRGLAVYDGKLYTACDNSHDVYVFDGTSWGKSGDVGNRPFGLAVYDGKLYTSCFGSDDVYVFDGTSWSKSGDVGTNPFGLAVYDGKLYTACYDPDDVYVFGNGSSVWATKSAGIENIAGVITDTDIEIYVDSISQNTSAHSISFATINDELYIGKSYGSSQAGYTGGNDELFRGKIYTTRFYNRALSSSEISKLYNGTHIDNGNLTAYYDFSEGSGDTLIDRSNNTNNGTIYGATWYDNYAVWGEYKEITDGNHTANVKLNYTVKDYKNENYSLTYQNYSNVLRTDDFYNTSYNSSYLFDNLPAANVTYTVNVTDITQYNLTEGRENVTIEFDATQNKTTFDYVYSNNENEFLEVLPYIVIFVVFVVVLILAVKTV